MRPWLALALLAAVGCGGPDTASPRAVAAGPPTAPPDAAPAPTPDAAPAEPDAEASFGAVPIPDDDFWSQPPTLDEIDTTVTLDELRAVGGWPAARRARGDREVVIALHATADGALQLSTVEHERGIVTGFALGAAAPSVNNHTVDGNAYPPFRWTEDPVSDAILFAVRVLPRDGADEGERRQVAVWAAGTELRAAERPAGGDWRPVLRVAFPAGTSFHAIGTTDPH